MVTVVGVRFKKAGKVYYFDPGDLDIDKGTLVVVETARGLECGEVVVGPKQVQEDEIVQPLKNVIREVTEEDLVQLETNTKEAARAHEIALEKIAEHGLPMKLIDTEYTFDTSKLIFYFTADGRVDFRELVKDLAAIFKTRIELRQIGVRDEAKMIGGLGSCGRALCCASFLGDFEPVSIKMAKEQNLSLNPTKISGICGRLMCCLKYESETYKEAKEELPNIGSTVLTEYGEAEVEDVNLLQGLVTVKVEDENYTLDADEVEEISRDILRSRKKVQESLNQDEDDVVEEFYDETLIDYEPKPQIHQHLEFNSDLKPDVKSEIRSEGKEKKKISKKPRRPRKRKRNRKPKEHLGVNKPQGNKQQS